MNILWLYARLLRLYPREFYERFHREMLDVFVQSWNDQPRGHIARLSFYGREFSGLLLSIAKEHMRMNSKFGPRQLFRWRLIPVWLFIVSLMLAAVISQNYWGYVTLPDSKISTLTSIDQIALVRFDADYKPHVIPLDDMPTAILTDFPPSQILSAVPTHLDMDKTLDPVLATQLSLALARAEVQMGQIFKYPREPVIHPNNGSFQAGVQFQADGSLLLIYPEIVVEGQTQSEAFVQRLTPNDAWYYQYINPAGYVVQGRDANGHPVIFTAIASRVGGDRHWYHELTFTQDFYRLILRDGIGYNFDIAGLEGINWPVITLMLFVPLLFLWGVILLFRVVIIFMGRRVTQWRSMA